MALIAAISRLVAYILLPQVRVLALGMFALAPGIHGTVTLYRTSASLCPANSYLACVLFGLCMCVQTALAFSLSVSLLVSRGGVHADIHFRGNVISCPLVRTWVSPNH